MTIHAYIRCSTDKQDESSQRHIIEMTRPAADTKRWEWYNDTASGGTPWQQRALARALEAAQPYDIIIVSEVSRIARSTVGVLTFLQAAAEKNVTVEAVKTGIKLDGSLQSKIVVTVLGLAAEIERDLLKARTKAALDARKRRGLPVGRQLGATGKYNKLAGKHTEIATLLDKKISKSGIARLLGVSRTTLDAFLKKTDCTANSETCTKSQTQEENKS